jgi:hypothetical protein
MWMMVIIQMTLHPRRSPMIPLRPLLALLTLAAAILAGGCAPTAISNQEGSVMSLEQTKDALRGEWVSIAPEIRPSATKNPDGSLKPFYLIRQFNYLGNDRFELTINNSADPYGKVPVVRIYLRGRMNWKGDHPIAHGAYKVNFVADEDYQVTPLVQPFADLLNKVAGAGYAKWEVNVPQAVFGKAFAPFGLVEGRNFMEYDLVYLARNMLFWGARNVDGRGFDREENRPTNLQIPLVRK